MRKNKLCKLLLMLSVMSTPAVINEVINENIAEASQFGWKQNNIGQWYYIENTGTLAINKWVGDYYLGSNGVMLTNTWTPDGYYVDTAGKWIPNKKREKEKPVQKLGWQKDGYGRWYYYENNGILAKNVWKGNYYLGNNGVMLTNTWTPDGYYVDTAGKWVPNKKREKEKPVQKLGWQKDSAGRWYYYEANGVLAKNVWRGNYYLGSNGIMLTNTWTPDGRYVDATGKLVPNKKKEEIKQEIKTGWQKDSAGRWYYYEANGVLAKNVWRGNYYLGSNGIMLINTWTPDGQYVDATGKLVPNKKKEEIKQEIKTGWQKDSAGRWYYYETNGILAKNIWKGDYYLGNNGVMLTNTWTPDGYYVDTAGKWVPNKKREKEKPVQKLGWQKDGYGRWYYYENNGMLAKNIWKGNYYLGNNGVMLTNTWTPDGYYVDASGKWLKGYTENKYVTSNFTNVIFLDPGHGGRDSGASYYGLREKDLVLQVYNKLSYKLRSAGYTVLSSRTSDVYVDFITERSRISNSTNADMFISIHFNASGKGKDSPDNGIETYWYKAYDEYPSKINQEMHNNSDRLLKSKLLAEKIHKNVVIYSGANDRGVRRNTFAVLRETNKPAVLLELGYMDNFNESLKIRNSDYQDKLVEGIFNGIIEYYNNQKNY